MSRALTTTTITIIACITLVLLPAAKSRASGTTASNNALGPTLQVGFITLGKTLRSTTERRLGYGLITTGTYPEGAREYRIPGGCLILDSDPYLKNGDSIIDQALWMNEKSTGPNCREKLTYYGLSLGSPKQDVLDRFGRRYTVGNYFDRNCFNWQRKLPGNIIFGADASFTNNRVSLLAVYEYVNN